MRIRKKEIIINIFLKIFFVFMTIMLNYFFVKRNEPPRRSAAGRFILPHIFCRSAPSLAREICSLIWRRAIARKYIVR
jgi:hypothetical protein